MPVYVASNHDSNPIGIVVARSMDLATAFWHGQGLVPYSVREITANDLSGHPTGVLPILRTKVVTGYEVSNFKKEKEYLLVSKI